MEKDYPSEADVKHDQGFSGRCCCGRSALNVVKFFYLLLVVNFVFVVLFVVVFLKLHGVQTQLSRLEMSSLPVTPGRELNKPLISENRTASPWEGLNTATFPTSTERRNSLLTVRLVFKFHIVAIVPSVPKGGHFFGFSVCTCALNTVLISLSSAIDSRTEVTSVFPFYAEHAIWQS